MNTALLQELEGAPFDTLNKIIEFYLSLEDKNPAEDATLVWMLARKQTLLEL